MSARRRGAMMVLGGILASAVVLFHAAAAFPYLPEFTGTQPDHWNFSAFPVVWNLNPNLTGSQVQGSVSVDQVMANSFAPWVAAPNAVVSVTRGINSTVSSEAGSPSNINLICFVCNDVTFTDAQTLALTITTTANIVGQSDGHGGKTTFVGQIIKADILFNPSTAFTTDGTCASGATCQNLQVVATHEIGHFLGLDHSAIVRAVMFPAASTLTSLSYDDVAGLSTLYPKGLQDVPTGSISGTISFASGGAVFGGHVYAESTTSSTLFPAAIRRSPIGTLTGVNGNYTIQGLPADTYKVTAEPLDGPVTSTDVSGYPPAFGQPAIQRAFTTRWH